MKQEFRRNHKGMKAFSRRLAVQLTKYFIETAPRLTATRLIVVTHYVRASYTAPIALEIGPTTREVSMNGIMAQNPTTNATRADHPWTSRRKSMRCVSRS